MNRDVDITFHLARSIRTRGSSHNMVGMTLGRRDSSNSRTVSGFNRLTRNIADQTSTRPSVFDVIIDETIDVSIQDNNFAVANFHLVSRDLEVSTISDHANRSGSIATSLSVGNSNGIDTGSCGRELFTFSVVLITPNIFIRVLILCIIRIHKRSRSRSDQSSLSTIANNVITRDRNLRSSNNNNVLFNRDSSNFTSLNNSLSCNIV